MAAEKTEKELLAEVSAKLDRLIATMAIQGKDQDLAQDFVCGGLRLGLDWRSTGNFCRCGEKAKIPKQSG